MELTTEHEEQILEAGRERDFDIKAVKSGELKLCENCKEYKEEVIEYFDIAGDPNDKSMNLCETCAIEMGLS